PWGDLWLQQGSAGYGFAGMPFFDPTTNTSITNARTYPNNLGHWMSPDLLAGDISNPQSLNRYAYALNNPTTFTDTLGLHWECASSTINGQSDGSDPSCTWVDDAAAPPTIGCANMDGYGCGYNGPNYAYTGGPTTSGGGGGAGTGTSTPPPPGPPPPPKAPPVTLTCLGTATFSDVSQSQMNSLLTNGPGGALQPNVVPTSGTVAIGGRKTFGLSYSQLQRFGPYITVNPSDLSGIISAMGGPTPPYTVSDIGDVNVRNSSGTRYDIYAFPDDTARNFGVQTSNATITVIPAVYGAHCPSGSSLISGPPQ
ncbi:MAG TPA: RHS repeat-associated core domain-containing protein, partial [Terriglobia bacterium]|nr:RHS repeat-associated core domain-containing protein [Terriglobia bacterium]